MGASSLTRDEPSLTGCKRAAGERVKATRQVDETPPLGGGVSPTGSKPERWLYRGSNDFKGLRHLQAVSGKRFHRGILLYTGSESVPFGPDLYALPVSALWQL